MIEIIFYDEARLLALLIEKLTKSISSARTDMNCIVVAASSDIGTSLCEEWIQKGYNVVGTFRSSSQNTLRLSEIGVHLVCCDINDSQSVLSAAKEIFRVMPTWDVLVLAAGTMEPIGLFEECSFSSWEKSVQINLLDQLRIVHTFLPSRGMQCPAGPLVLFFAGSGTNGAAPRYSAYTLSKIACIKFCELMDAEMPDTRFCIIGPGWVKTKIHQETLAAGSRLAGNSYAATLERFDSGSFVPMEKVVSVCNWLISQPKSIISGRNFSVAHDAFSSDAIVNALKSDGNMYKLRRSGNDWMQNRRS